MKPHDDDTEHYFEPPLPLIVGMVAVICTIVGIMVGSAVQHMSDAPKMYKCEDRE